MTAGVETENDGAELETWGRGLRGRGGKDQRKVRLVGNGRGGGEQVTG